jgi:hypothetical protein
MVWRLGVIRGSMVSWLFGLSVLNCSSLQAGPTRAGRARRRDDTGNTSSRKRRRLTEWRHACSASEEEDMRRRSSASRGRSFVRVILACACCCGARVTMLHHVVLVRYACFSALLSFCKGAMALRRMSAAALEARWCCVRVLVWARGAGCGRLCVTRI